MDSENTPESPLSFDISKLPEDFGSARLYNLLVAFDNIDNQSGYNMSQTSFPVKSDAMFTIAMLKGGASFLINLHEVELRAGQVLIMMPGCIFQVRNVSDDAQYSGLMLDAEFVEVMRKSVGLNVNLAQRYYNFMVKTMTPAGLENYGQMYQMIRRELDTDDYTYKKEVLQRYCEIWMLRNISMEDNTERALDLRMPKSRKEEIFHDFLTLLEKYYTEERSISFYANRMFLTPKYLSTVIKEVSGKHGMQWIDDYVALEAKALLRSSTLSVKQVSDQLNFPSQSMFGRFFKKMTGYSPKQYKLL